MKALRSLNELLQKLEDIVSRITESDTVCILHHDDSDGCSSAALFSILLHKLTGEYPILFPIRGENNVDKRLINKLKSINPTYVFVLDVTVNPKRLNLFRGFVLDHHVYDGIVQRDEMPYFNPRSFEKIEERVVPISYISYRLVRRMLPEEKVAWIAAIGITEDHRVELCKDVFERVMKENPELLKTEVITQPILEKSIFGQLMDMVRSGRMVKKIEGARTAVQALIECKDRPDKFINGLTQHSLALRMFYERVSYEAQKCLMDVERLGKFYHKKKVIVYEIKGSKISALTSYIADKIRQMYPEWIVCVIGEEYGMKRKKISIRLEQTKRNENLIYILKKVMKTIPTVKGGGHKCAIGVSVHSNYINGFFQEFLKLI